ACNQACLDHVFERKTSSCLVNPRACQETKLNYVPAKVKKKIGVVGAGPAGLGFATAAAGRGHEVHLYEAAAEIGGQFNMAKRIPGKEEFHETIRYFRKQIEKTGVHLHLNTRADAGLLVKQGFDEVVIATGVLPRQVQLEGIGHPKVLSYIEVLKGLMPVGERVAIIGAGGIGFDVAEFLTHEGEPASLNVEAFMEEWGVDMDYNNRGALTQPAPEPPARQVFLCQRSKGKPGAGLGKTTGWVHRTALRRRNVKMLSEVQYERIDDQGLHLTVKGKPRLLEVDNVVICAGQEPLRDLWAPLKEKGVTVHLIGGADEARELDAKRAIYQASWLAAGV
ncbi:MAG: FAD-dependent oxidoreductase, partial [Phaeodactylibacter sp.]|nr:FAD-dependent oxidoreductase [Phaeodactylibacter sp.]